MSGAAIWKALPENVRGDLESVLGYCSDTAEKGDFFTHIAEVGVLTEQELNRLIDLDGKAAMSAEEVGEFKSLFAKVINRPSEAHVYARARRVTAFFDTVAPRDYTRDQIAKASRYLDDGRLSACRDALRRAVDGLDLSDTP